MNSKNRGHSRTEFQICSIETSVGKIKESECSNFSQMTAAEQLEKGNGEEDFAEKMDLIWFHV